MTNHLLTYDKLDVGSTFCLVSDTTSILLKVLLSNNTSAAIDLTTGREIAVKAEDPVNYLVCSIYSKIQPLQI